MKFKIFAFILLISSVHLRGQTSVKFTLDRPQIQQTDDGFIAFGFAVNNPTEFHAIKYNAELKEVGTYTKVMEGVKKNKYTSLKDKFGNFKILFEASGSNAFVLHMDKNLVQLSLKFFDHKNKERPEADEFVPEDQKKNEVSSHHCLTCLNHGLWYFCQTSAEKTARSAPPKGGVKFSMGAPWERMSIDYSFCCEDADHKEVFSTNLYESDRDLFCPGGSYFDLKRNQAFIIGTYGSLTEKEAARVKKKGGLDPDVAKDVFMEGIKCFLIDMGTGKIIQSLKTQYTTIPEINKGKGKGEENWIFLTANIEQDETGDFYVAGCNYGKQTGIHTHHHLTNNPMMVSPPFTGFTAMVFSGNLTVKSSKFFRLDNMELEKEPVTGSNLPIYEMGRMALNPFVDYRIQEKTDRDIHAAVDFQELKEKRFPYVTSYLKADHEIIFLVEKNFPGKGGNVYSLNTTDGAITKWYATQWLEGDCCIMDPDERGYLMGPKTYCFYSYEPKTKEGTLQKKDVN